MAKSKNTKTESAGAASGWRFAVRALQYRNYRLFFGGQSISLIGSWMTRVAMNWLVYRLTDSAFLLGVIGFAGQIPALILAPFAGVWVDRLNRHSVLLWTQVLSMLQSFALAWLALTHRINIHHVVWLSLFQGVVNAFDMPARQSFLVEMVERREDLPNAIALNSSMVNASRLVGPSLAGIIIAGYGEGNCFLIDGISYIAVIASLLLMRLKPEEEHREERDMMQELREGWQYVAGFHPVRSVLLVLALVSLVGMPYTVLMPIFASQILHGGPNTLGFLMGASGVGALISAISLAARKSVLGLGKMIPISAFMFGAGLAVFAVSRWFWLSMALMLVTGFGMMQQMAASNTILQTIVPDEKRGRVMSYYTMAFMGVSPFGSLFAGVVADRIGAPKTLLIGGVATVVGSLWFASQLRQIREAVRPIYVRIGILPEIASGLQTASVLLTPPEK